MPKTTKILVSTKDTQGQRSNDFCYVPEGEPVRFGIICDRDKGRPDGGCGCARSLVGIYCSKGTTTFKVALSELTKAQIIEDYIENDPFKIDDEDDEIIEALKEDTEFLLDLAAEYPVGSVFEYRAGKFFLRKGAKA